MAEKLNKPELRDVQKPLFGVDLTALQPKLTDVYLGGGESQSKGSQLLDQLLNMSTRKRMATEAVAGRRREQEQMGMVPYAPANRGAANAAARNRVSETNLPQPEMAAVETVQQRPTGGQIINYPSGEKIVMGSFGSGTRKEGPKKPTMIEGIPASAWYAKAAGRQGESNKFAVALPTGKKDELGREKYRGMSFAKAETMSPEKQKALVYDAMNSKRA